MKPHKQFFLLLFLLLSWNALGQGTLSISFEGLPLIPAGAAYTVTNYNESGVSFRPIPNGYGFGRIGIDPQGGRPDNGTAYLQAAFTESLMFGFTNGSTFGLVSVDLAEYNAGFQAPLTVHFIGHRSDGSTITTDFMTDGIIDGTGPLADFQTFYFDSSWDNLMRVEVPGWGWSLDNLVVSVPEPASATLFIASGLLLWARRKIAFKHSTQRDRIQ